MSSVFAESTALVSEMAVTRTYFAQYDLKLIWPNTLQSLYC